MRKSIDIQKGLYEYAVGAEKKALQLINKGVVLDKDRTDDLLYHLDVKVKDLPLLIELGAFKRRPNIYGKWIAGKEKQLGHKIFPYLSNERDWD